MAGNLNTEKAVILCGTLVATLCFGLIPIQLLFWSRHRHLASVTRVRRIKKLITFANCFSGGVFVAACLLDLFPDVRESIDHVLDEIEYVYHTKIDYPVAEFVIVFGFFLVLIVEQIVMEIKEKRGVDGTASVAVNGESGVLPTETDGLLASESTNISRRRNVSSQSKEPDHDMHFAMFEEHSALRSLMLLLALTFHSLFEGLAIGLQEDNGQLISIFIAVMVHKAVMAFSLGLNLAQSHGMTVAYFVSANLLFSVASPIGMAIGIVVSDMNQSISRDIANGVLQGIAGGTFLYITFFEVLPHEFASNKMRLPKVLCVLFGYSIICGLLFLTH